MTTLPSFASLSKLRRVNIGQMRGLESIARILDAPALRELFLSKCVNLTEHDVQRIIDHPDLQRFGWFGEDVPARIWVPVMDRVKLPEAKILSPAAWFAEN